MSLIGWIVGNRTEWGLENPSRVVAAGEEGKVEISKKRCTFLRHELTVRSKGTAQYSMSMQKRYACEDKKM